MVTFALEQEAEYRAERRCAATSAARASRSKSAASAARCASRCRVASTSRTQLGALAACHERGRPLEPLLAALERPFRVPGRFEPVTEDEPFAVLVDYAHTPDSLENVLAAARGLVDGSGRARDLRLRRRR